MNKYLEEQKNTCSIELLPYISKVEEQLELATDPTTKKIFLDSINEIRTDVSSFIEVLSEIDQLISQKGYK